MSAASTASPPDRPRYLSAAEASRRLNTHYGALQRLVAAGRVRRRTIPGLHPQYSEEDVERLLREAE